MLERLDLSDVHCIAVNQVVLTFGSTFVPAWSTSGSNHVKLTLAFGLGKIKRMMDILIGSMSSFMLMMRFVFHVMLKMS